MLRVVEHSKAHTRELAQTFGEGIKASVTRTLHNNWLARNRHASSDQCLIIATRVLCGLIAIESVWLVGIEVFAGELVEDLLTAYFLARTVGDRLNDAGELDLHTAGQVETLLGLKQVRNAALA